MRIAVALLCCWLALGRATAQSLANMTTAISESRQFVAQEVRKPASLYGGPKVREVPGGFVLIPNFTPSLTSDISLDPALLVISCEKIKQSLLTALGQQDQWRGQINLFINPALSQEDGPFLSGRQGTGGWNYKLALPSSLKRQVLVRAVVRALLVEMANREGGSQSVEVPAWLVAGLSARLQSESLTAVVLQSEVSLFSDKARQPGLEKVRQQLRQQPALTFQQLSWPEEQWLTADNADFFCASSELFFEELLRFPDGSRCLNEMIRQLPRHMNWQTSFLQAFAPHFKQLLDVEKWWDLACVSFTQVDLADHFNPEDSWIKFQNSLTVPVEIRQSAEAMPALTEVTLQEVVATWDPVQAAPVLQRTMQSLELLRLKAAPELAKLLDGYLASLHSWIYQTRPDSPAWTAKNHEVQLAGLRNATCRELSILDGQRAALRPQKVASAAASPRANSLHAPTAPDVRSSSKRPQQP
jgi:hypothetical protein